MANAAPTLRNLAECLERNSGFDVAEESGALVREKVSVVLYFTRK